MLSTPTRLALGIAVASTAAAAAVAAPAGASTAPQHVVHTVLTAGCGLQPSAGYSRCHAKLHGNAHAKPLATAAPTAGYGPADLQSAYNVAAAAAANGASQTIAIVDAYDDKTAEADLATYRSQYGLPACTTANGCFKKVNQSGVQGSYPAN